MISPTDTACRRILGRVFAGRISARPSRARQSVRILPVRAIRHNGLAFVDILQPCPTYNDINTKDWYSAKDAKDPQTGSAGQRLYRLEAPDYDAVVHKPEEQEAKMLQAIQRGAEWGDRIPIGVFYENTFVPTFEERIAARQSTYRASPPGRQRLADDEGRSMVKFDDFVGSLKL